MNSLMMMAEPGAGAFVTQILLIGLMFGFLYFFMIRPQKKKEKQMAEMRNALQVGDEIVSIGGIIGIIVSIRDDSVVVETGTDRSKLCLSKWAIQSNTSPKGDE